MATINTTLNDVFKLTPLGNTDSPIGTVLYGINHRQTPNPVPINRDGYGLTFITRPQLNLTTQNLRAMRELIPLLTTNLTSIPAMIRGYLDPRLKQPCPVMDNQSAFIPILTNHMLSCSGWPDPYVDVHTSKQGVFREVHSMVDSTIDRFQAYDVTCSFRNMVGDPITEMMRVWTIYMTEVFKGNMTPYPDFIAYNEIDYNCRIYRLVLDRSKRFVQKIGCTGASFPKNTPIGQAFDFQHDKPINPNNDQITINFQSNGYRYQDSMVTYDFNKVVGIFNPSMSEANYQTHMTKLLPSELQIFNNRGYPRINEDTMELNWYVSKQEYISTMTAYVRTMNAITNSNIYELPNR